MTKEYKWDNPHEWLQDAFRAGKVSGEELLLLCNELDADTIQDFFQSSMDTDGYFGVEDEEEEEDEEDGAWEECYYADPNTCRGEVWQCKTCKEWYCNEHWHETELGRNVECVACEGIRLGRQ